MSQTAADRYAWAEPGVEDLGGGVHRIPLPLPIDGLKAVNVYAIAEPGGVDLIDAGIALVPARERLTAALRELGYELGDVRNFFVTHVHIDHYSLAIELRKTFRSVVFLGEEERANLIAIREMVNGRRPGSSAPRACAGWVHWSCSTSLTVSQGTSRPRSTGRTPTAGWQTGPTSTSPPGRSARCTPPVTPAATSSSTTRRREIMFAGDHVLPHITPSIGSRRRATGRPCWTTSARWPGRWRCLMPGCCLPTAPSPRAPTNG